MKKHLIFSSLLFSNLLYTGCVQKNVAHTQGSYRNTPIQTTQTNRVESRPTYQTTTTYQEPTPSNTIYEEYYEEEVVQEPYNGTTVSYETSSTPTEYYQEEIIEAPREYYSSYETDIPTEEYSYEENIEPSNSNVAYTDSVTTTQEYYPTETQPTSQYQSSTPPPAVTEGVGKNFKSVQGNNIRIAKNPTGLTFPQYQGKIILLEIFGKDCHYCFEEMPIINQMRAKYGNSLQVIAIQGQDPMSPATSAKLIQQYSMNYPIIERDVAHELLLFISETYGWMGVLPYIQLIKNGVTEFNFGDGGVSAQELSKSIDSLM